MVATFRFRRLSAGFHLRRFTDGIGILSLLDLFLEHESMLGRKRLVDSCQCDLLDQTFVVLHQDAACADPFAQPYLLGLPAFWFDLALLGNEGNEDENQRLLREITMLDSVAQGCCPRSCPDDGGVQIRLAADQCETNCQSPTAPRKGTGARSQPVSARGFEEEIPNCDSNGSLFKVTEDGLVN